MKSPFALSGSRPGEGRIKLSLLPPSSSVLEQLSYQYPLKLISPSVVRLARSDDEDSLLVYTVFLLTYGGGLVAGDAVSLDISLAPATRLVLLTQGSTKVFKSDSPKVITRQHMNVSVASGAAMCYLPDPVQPFASSAFEQKQVYNITSDTANLCVCDWVCEGRTARGEKWSFWSYASRNEVWLAPAGRKRRLLLRDNIILDSGAVSNTNVAGRMNDVGVYGTLILCGELMSQLAAFFIAEFRLLPRIGNRQWDAPSAQELSQVEMARAMRVAQEKKDELLWTVAETRGFVVVKFGAKEVEGAKRWLRNMLKADGSVEREFGERALLCIR